MMEIPKIFQKYITSLLSSDLNPRVVFTDGADKRVIGAANWLTKKQCCKCILVTKASIATEQLTEEYAQKLVKLREHKGLTIKDARKLVQLPQYFGALLVLDGKADIIISGANITTKEALRPFLQLFRKNNEFVSSIFLMVRDDKAILVTDCALNFVTSANVLANIAENVYWFHKRLFQIEPRVALLSFSTNNSGSGGNVLLVQEAFQILINQKAYQTTNFYGEIQFDAAVSKTTAKTKNITSPVAGNANCFVFPSLNSANIGYKIMASFGNFQAIGPILTNLNHLCSDLSRGCNSTEIVLTTLLLCKQFINNKTNG